VSYVIYLRLLSLSRLFVKDNAIHLHRLITAACSEIMHPSFVSLEQWTITYYVNRMSIKYPAAKYVRWISARGLVTGFLTHR
jgi:hypothetical protein